VTENRRTQTRRSALVGLLTATTTSMVVGARAASATGKPVTADGPGLAGDMHDFDFLVGSWTVQHRRLKARLAGSTDWEEFPGACVAWLTLGGQGNVDDNVLELPGKTYRAVSIRVFDPKAGQWSIWWIDSRYADAPIDPPVRGSFKDGVGTFLTDSALNDRPIKSRFLWSQITPASARWEQAFSPDAGATWETNWIMDFTRVRP
jgi:hypothetical protein